MSTPKATTSGFSSIEVGPPAGDVQITGPCAEKAATGCWQRPSKPTWSGLQAAPTVTALREVPGEVIGPLSPAAATNTTPARVALSIATDIASSGFPGEVMLRLQTSRWS